jgi:hypothetical protein
MEPGDAIWTNADSRPLCIEVRRGDGQYWDWTAKPGAFAVPAKPLDASRFALQLKGDAVNPTVQRGVIPKDAMADAGAEVIEALWMSGGVPIPTGSWWLGEGNTADGVPMATATGAVLRFVK